ncbi:hypothetical protein ASPBRDRAFT_118951 [Aspergillus brasiliensis CBS 101740]|uniref:J domain-containing protein n=1 Tax=Aspergillus brasiliensis (strain CBS 101740 / IMI 381727 / IBT 21946) TaxID=767769 RepID=A0A1L9UTE5_ASPBC|nr:hypothetical protein ASPBRDRAFT_118951 [Aspergillus brasiliensis CBS 101740]
MYSTTRVTNYYSILGISHNSTLKDINSAYKRLALKHHPDKQGTGSGDVSNDEFQKIQKAIEILRDPIRKQEHDDVLRGAGYYFCSVPFISDDEYEDWEEGTWRPTSGKRYDFSDPKELYKYKYGHSVHMDPFAPESLVEKARVEIEIRVGEQLKREAEAAEAAAAAAAAAGDVGSENGDDEGEEDEGVDGGVLFEKPQHFQDILEYLRKQEFANVEKRKRAMQANVDKDEERLRNGEEEEFDDDKEFSRGYGNEYCWRSKEAGSDVPREWHEDFYYNEDDGVYYGGDEDEGEGEYEEEEDDDDDEENDEGEDDEDDNRRENKDDDEDDEQSQGPGAGATSRPNDNPHESDRYDDDSYYHSDEEEEYEGGGNNNGADIYFFQYSSTAIKQPASGSSQSTEYMTARCTRDSEEEYVPDEAGGISLTLFMNQSPQSSESSISSSSSIMPRSSPSIEPNTTANANIDDPLLWHFYSKLTDRSNLYTSQDFLFEVTGLIFEIYCQWLEGVRLTFPEAKPLTKGQGDAPACLHLGGWEKRFGREKCGGCHLRQPLYMLICPGCGVEMCVGCRLTSAAGAAAGSKGKGVGDLLEGWDVAGLGW